MYKPRSAFLLHKLKTIGLQDLHPRMMEHLVKTTEEEIAVLKEKFAVSMEQLLCLTYQLRTMCDGLMSDKYTALLKVSMIRAKIWKCTYESGKEPTIFFPSCHWSLSYKKNS